MYVYVTIKPNWKAYMGSPLMRFHLTSVTLEGQSQGKSDFEAYRSRKGAALGHMLLLPKH